MRISDWSSDVCSSDLGRHRRGLRGAVEAGLGHHHRARGLEAAAFADADDAAHLHPQRLGVHPRALLRLLERGAAGFVVDRFGLVDLEAGAVDLVGAAGDQRVEHFAELRSEEHTSELQSLMRISYAVFCLKKKKNTCNKLRKD